MLRRWRLNKAPEERRAQIVGHPGRDRPLAVGAADGKVLGPAAWHTQGTLRNRAWSHEGFEKMWGRRVRKKKEARGLGKRWWLVGVSECWGD